MYYQSEASTMNNIFILRDENKNIQYFIKYDSFCQFWNKIYDKENDNENYLNYYENYYIVNQSNDCYNESYIHNGYYLKEGDFINVNIIVKFEVKMFCLKMIKNVLLVMIIIIWKMRIVF